MTPAPPRVLVAGIGNMFLRDDGFGPEVVRRVAAGPVPDGVRVVDYGVRGMHLAYDLLDEWDTLVLVDAVPDRGHPGEVRVIEMAAAAPPAPHLDAHGMDPAAVFATLTALGGRLPPTVVVGCQVADVDEGIGLSDAVAAAVDPAVARVRALVRDACPPIGAGVRRGGREG